MTLCGIFEVNSIGGYNNKQMNNQNNLWKYADLARFLKVSESKLRRDVMNKNIPFIKIGRVVRFDKNQIAEYFKIKIQDEEKAPKPKKENINDNKPIKDTVTWLSEQSKKYPYAEISLRIVIHDNQIRQVDRTITEKIRDKNLLKFL